MFKSTFLDEIRAEGEAQGEAKLLIGQMRERLKGQPLLDRLIERIQHAPAEAVEQAGLVLVRHERVSDIVAELDRTLPP